MFNLSLITSPQAIEKELDAVEAKEPLLTARKRKLIALSGQESIEREDLKKLKPMQFKKTNPPKNLLTSFKNLPEVKKDQDLQNHMGLQVIQQNFLRTHLLEGKRSY